jgi:hypothetical protein
MASADLVKPLIEIESHPWAEMGKSQKPLTQARLARMLKPLGIASEKIGPKTDRVAGYILKHFDDAFDRYLAPEAPKGDSKADTRTQCDEIRTSENFQSGHP